MKNLLKEKRQSLNMSRKEIADKVGVNQRMIQSYELGIKNPPAKYILKLVNAYELTYEEMTIWLEFLESNTNDNKSIKKE